MKRFLIAGSRNRNPLASELDCMFRSLHYYLDGPVTVVSGGAKGVDTAGEKWAAERHHHVDLFEPDWKANGRSAGYIRNAEMVASGLDAAIVFWDGSSKGTKHTLGLLEEAGVPRVVVVV